VRFDGRYPIGRVAYRDADCPVTVQLEAFSPFIPLNVDDSSLPATVMSFRVKNTSNAAVDIEILGQLQNAICLETKPQQTGQLRNRIIKDGGFTALACSAEPPAKPDSEEPRPDIAFDSFERPTYQGWTTEGAAFGDGPVEKKNIPNYQGDVGGEGKRVVNSHASAPGNDVREKDSHVGTLTSRPFTIQRRFVQFLVGGGAHRGRTCVNLLIDGKPVASATGRNDNRMFRTAFNVRQFEGKEARLRVVDQFAGGWGNIGVDDIIFTDRPLQNTAIEQQRDFGTMTLALLGPGNKNTTATADLAARDASAVATADLSAVLVGQLARSLHLEPGEQRPVEFVVAWHFPNFRGLGVDNAPVGHSYAARFDSALAVTRCIAADFDRLAGDTRTWVDTWYDSSLPYWLLDRTMANTSTLATTTCYRFEDGRFWAWEGIGCCHGTCTHVWHYAQAPGRLFPKIERIERERVNFGIGQHADGGIGMRTKLNGSNEHADDGHCGRVLGVFREHQMSADATFLRRLWPKVKKAVEFMIRRDGNADGMLEGAQPNTLDANWYGKISFISSLYLAMLKAGKAMATEMGDEQFAEQCRKIAERGEKSILETFNGEYFVQIEDPRHKDKIGVGSGCYVDQVFGQTWAHWVGLGRLFDRKKQLSALRALWRYNFVPDIGPFRKRFVPGRWYAAAGDAGLIMCSWPKGGKNP
ncbi:MAG: GH116 family glycosyl hydrolase, partial [Planctomycetota bacterium]